MKIGFLIGFPEISGGTYVIFEHASGLLKLGHDVSIITEDTVDPKRYEWHGSAGSIEWITFNDLVNKEYDFVIATWWRSSLDLARVNAKNYVYFVQSIESKFFGEDNGLNADQRACRNLCEKTYFLNVNYITEATWIKEHLANEFGHKASLVRNGIRKDLYDVNGREENSECFRVLVEGALDVPFKNVARTIELAKQSNADEVWLLTPSKVEKYDGVDKVFSQIPIDKVGDVYAKCDVLVKLSYVEGMFGPPLEMFHCGGTSIVYDVTGHDEYIIDRENAIVVKTDEESEVVKSINSLKNDKEYCEKLKVGALRAAEAWPSWRDSTKEFEQALIDIPSKTSLSLKNINKYTNVLWTEYRRDLEYYAQALYFDNSEVGDVFEIFVIKNGAYSGNNVYRAEYTRNKRTTIALEIENLEETREIRLDPSIYVGFIKIYDIKIYKKDLLVFSLIERFNLRSMRIAGTSNLWNINECNVILHSDGNDPNVLIELGTLLVNGQYSIEIDFLSGSAKEVLL